MAKPKSSGKRKGKQQKEKEKMEDHDVSYDKKDQITIKMSPINSLVRSYLVDRKRETIQGIGDKFKVEIHFSSAKDPYPNISITGFKDNCYKCTDKLVNLKKEDEDQFKITVLINSHVNSYLVGLKGETIRKIMDKFKVEIRLPSAEDSNPNIISITGLKNNCYKCTDHLLNLEKEYDSPPGFPLAPIATVSLVIVAVALLVAVFTESADFGSFSESVKDFISETYSVVFNFLASSAKSISETFSVIFSFLVSFANSISETFSVIFSFLVSFANSITGMFSIILNFLMASTNSNFCNPITNKTCDEFLYQKFRNLGLKYNEQSSGTWVTLYAAAHDHVSYQPNPQRPIVIMVYRLKDLPNATQVVEDIAGAYDSVLPPFNDNGDIIINGTSFMDLPPEETQKQIQDMLENGFENKGQKVAIVHDFDKLPSCSVLTFHNYCNNEDAPHKKVAIILTVTGMEEELPSNPKSADLEKAVKELFYEKWKDCPKELPPGKIDAMLSRIANNVILLR